jgi:mannose-1-phosphate guanylyltransferase
LYAMIIAGGVGSRMWPMSRLLVPKQFLNLTGQETMIQATVRRVADLIPPERIFVVTGNQYVTLARGQLPAVPAGNIIGEMSGKNTAPAIGLGALHILKADPDAVMVVLPADHMIPDEAAFHQALVAAEAVAETGRLVTLGILPIGPETGYGYIHRGAPIGWFNGQPVYQVERFLEKPDLITAQRFYASGRYYWNSGMFIWRVSTLLEAMAQHMPALAGQLQAIEKALFSEDSSTDIESLWAQITSQSIDVGLMEKAENVAVVPLDAGWNDVGSWAALYDELAETSAQNVAVNARHLSVDSSGVLIEGNGKLIATIGVENLVIIQTEDALLVCHKDKTQDVKKIVEQLKSAGAQAYL